MMLLLLTLLACGNPTNPVPPVPEGAAFPHPADYEQVHGRDAVAEDAACATCHSPSRGAPSAGPACTTCHVYPHPLAFAAGEEHGPKWRSAGESACADCHGDDGRRHPADVAEGACTSCHTTFPHLRGWEEPARHGAATLAHGGPQACAVCHGGLDALPTEDQCGSCHAAWPHPSGWGRPSTHGAAYLDDPTSCGTVCHAHPEPTAPPSCARCHDTFPHPSDWTLGHIAPVQQRSEAACTGCHPAGSLDAPDIPTASCGPSCHGSSR